MTAKLTFNAISFLLSMLTLFTLAFPSGSAQAQSLLDSSRQNSCANGLIAGDYGLIGQGNIVPGGPLPPNFAGPFAQVGLINFSAAGSFAFSAVNSVGAQVQPLATIRGNFSVAPDCTINLLDENNITLRGVVTKNGDEMLLTPTTPGIAVAVRGFRIKPNDDASSSDNPFDRARRFTCSNGTLKGTFGFDALGMTTVLSGLPAPLAGAFSSIGQVTYDGAGNVTLSAAASFNGVPQALQNVKGTYSVNENCTFTSRLENGPTFYAVIVNAGQELLVIQTNNGVAAVGVAKKINPPTNSNRPPITVGGGSGSNPGGTGSGGNGSGSVGD